MNKKAVAICYALAAALFYAINVPCSKLLLNNIPPTFLAAFLYLGAGVGVGIMYLFQYKKEPPGVRLKKSDIPFTIGMVALDIIAPILLMLGIKLGTAANASLLGNSEIVATAFIAFLLFRERISRRLWIAVALITLSGIILSFGGAGTFRFSLGSIFVLGATVCWGLENNCTRKIAKRSTYQIVTVKGFGSGTGSLIIALVSGEAFPDIKLIFPALLLGFVAYGLSIFTYIRAQKKPRRRQNERLLCHRSVYRRAVIVCDFTRRADSGLFGSFIIYDSWNRACGMRYACQSSFSRAFTYFYSYARRVDSFAYCCSQSRSQSLFQD